MAEVTIIPATGSAISLPVAGTAGQLVFFTAPTTISGTSNLFYNSGTGFLGVGNTSPETALHVSSSLTTSPRGVMSSQHNTGTEGARFHMRKSRGTKAAPTVIVSGDMLGRLVASGYDGANYLEMGAIEILSSGTIAATRIPTEIRFHTATDAAPSILTEAMRIDNVQNVTIQKNFIIPATTSAVGAIFQGANKVFHSYGTRNLFVGVTSGNVTLTSTDTAAFGNGTLTGLTSGVANCAFGQGSLVATQDGNRNCGFGKDTLKANISGSGHCAFGHESLLSNATGGINSGFGFSTLRQNATGVGNSAFGGSCLYNCSSSYNTGGGDSTLYNTSTGEKNSAWGWRAGITNTTGSNNSYFGYSADGTANNFSNSSAFGCNAKVGASNCLVLGGTGADQPNGGIGLTIPTSMWHIYGSKAWRVRTVTDTTAVDGTYNVILCNKATAMDIDLPAASTCADRVYHIKNINVGVVTIDPNGGELIDGAAGFDLSTQWSSAIVACDGTGWYIL